EVWRFEGSEFQSTPISIELLFKAVVQYKASDIHLIAGRPPIFRIDNQLRASELMGNLSARQIEDLIETLASDSDWTTFREKLQCSFSFHHVGIGYARVSAFIKAGAPHLTFRFLPEKIPSFDDLGLDKEMMLSFSNMSDGLLLVAGMTGSGKTSTCAAVVDWINENKSIHIVCLEDPVEYIHQSKKGFISQREAGVDVNSIGDGVKGVTHQDTNVLFIGEMNDVETIRGALNAASTGTLVISTIHSSNASGVVNRIVSFFDPVERDLIRSQLQANLTGVICQKLVPKIKGGRIPAIEVLFNDVKNIADAIKQGNTAGIRLGMQHNLSESKLFEKHLHELYKADKISLETARENAPEISMFDQLNMGTYKAPRMESG
ncbi:MAG: Flp pilus assembly complex ATPase component TadA, partial [Candidatus Hydrogenedentes bacterium]|nr:Flp pilus assembly complex ATPase component TadA [Candidatus Hydrogenedentota bacterium]